MRRPKIAARDESSVCIPPALRMLFVAALLLVVVLFDPWLHRRANGGLMVEKFESSDPADPDAESIGDIGFSRPRVGETNLSDDEPANVEPWPEDGQTFLIEAVEESPWFSTALALLTFSTEFSTIVTIWAEEFTDAAVIQLVDEALLTDMSNFVGFFDLDGLGLAWDSDIDQIQMDNTGLGGPVPVPDVRKYKLFAIGLMIVSYFAWRRIEGMS